MIVRLDLIKGVFRRSKADYSYNTCTILHERDSTEMISFLKEIQWSKFVPSLLMLKSVRHINEYSKLFNNWVYALANEIIARPLTYQPLDNTTLYISNTLPQKHILLINWHRVENLGCKLENIFRPCVQPTYAHQAHPLLDMKT